MSAQTESTYRTTRLRVCSLLTEASQHSRSPWISTRRSRVCSRPLQAERQGLSLSVSRCVMGEDKVAIFGGLVAGIAGFVHRLAGRLAVLEISESPAARRGVL